MTDSAGAPPRRIFLIRHGEKPETDKDVQGVTALGQPSEHSLTPRGWQHGGALAVLFGDPALAAARSLNIPARLFSPDYGEHTNRRTTLTALAQFLELAIEHPVPVDHGADLATTVLSAGPGPILVGWEHHRIPDIAAALGRHRPTPPRAIRLTRARRCPQNLLAQDTTTTPA